MQCSIFLQNPKLFNTWEIGRNNWMTSTDLQKLKSMYGCSGMYLHQDSFKFFGIRMLYMQ